jgi:hypothetical protein
MGPGQDISCKYARGASSAAVHCPASCVTMNSTPGNI